jgi:thiosulfate/3-mercaptopyruvate sulfurtransferase
MPVIQDPRGSPPNGVEDPWKGAIGSLFPSNWVVDAASAHALIASGAVVFQARGSGPKATRPIPNAAPVSWQHFSHEDVPIKGRLLDDDLVLTQRLRALGVLNDAPVVVVDDSKLGGGEAGRLTWTLRTLGHPLTYLVDGGVAALLEGEMLPVKPPPISGDFTVTRDLRFQITREQLRNCIGTGGITILDVREPREYAGETPYGESRGGHVPGAKHLFYKALLDSEGKVLPRDQIKTKLSEIGVKDDDEVVSYCTGGVRAGLVTVLLNDLGITARNYAGSMWEWSASPPDRYPLNKNSEG